MRGGLSFRDTRGSEFSGSEVLVFEVWGFDTSGREAQRARAIPLAFPHTDTPLIIQAPATHVKVI